MEDIPTSEDAPEQSPVTDRAQEKQGGLVPPKDPVPNAGIVPLKRGVQNTGGELVKECVSEAAIARDPVPNAGIVPLNARPSAKGVAADRTRSIERVTKNLFNVEVKTNFNAKAYIYQGRRTYQCYYFLGPF